MSITNEKIVETKTCTHCGARFDITDRDMEFYDKISPTFDGKKYSIPTPKFCPECRNIRRFSFRNERNFFKRKCDATGQNIISMYAPDKECKVYNQDFWWSDNWDAMNYGKEIDFELSLLQQFSKLITVVPRINLLNQKSENSPYSNYESDEKNCYMTVGGHWNEDCMYGNYYMKSKDSIDNYWLFESSVCYECIHCHGLHNCFYLINSKQCNDCFLGYDLMNCNHCFGCVGLRNKEFYIFNKKYSKDEYKKQISQLQSLPLDVHKEKMRDISLDTCRKNLNISSSQNCMGDEIFHSQNVVNSFQIEEFDICKYALIAGMGKKCMDVSCVGLIELSYECAHGGLEAYKNIFSVSCYGCNNIYYSYNCHYSSDLFLCVGIRNKKYCILNKQYTKEEYEELVPKIINKMKQDGEWGEFFPSSMSPFGYNETVANEYFPLNKEEAQQQGFNWSDYEAPFPKVEKIIPANQLPEDIKDIPDDILNWAIECELTKKPFRIIPQELEFYRKHNLPIPKRHPDQRHLDRMSLRNPRKLFDRECSKCGCEMKTTYAPDRPEKVYCEECYNKEIY